MKHCIKVDEHYIFTPATLQATYGTQFKVLSSIYAVTQVKAKPHIKYSNSSSEHYYLPAFPSNQPAKQSHLASFSYSDLIKIARPFVGQWKSTRGKTPLSCRNRSILS